jgi:sugar phosphate isomerase/epimerase
MILGYSTNAYTRHTLEEAIARIAALGFKGIELMGDRPHLYPPDYDAARLEALRKALQAAGLKVTNLNSFTLFAVGDTYLPSWIEPQPERRAMRVNHTLQCLEIAAFLGCGNISVPPGGPLEAGMTRREALRLFHQGLAQVAPRAEALGVRILVEPEPTLLVERTAEFAAFIAEVRSPAIGLNFDIGHFFCAGEDPAEAFETLRPHIGHVHLEDIGIDRRHHHLIPGRGAIDLRRVLAAMRRLDYRGDVSLELYTCADAPDAAGRASLAYLGPLLAEAGWEAPAPPDLS